MIFEEELRVALKLELHRNQVKLRECKARNKAVLAGKRFGKTKWLLFELCDAAAFKKNGRFWYIAPTYGQAEEIAWAELSEMVPDSIIRRKLDSKLMIEFTSGSTLKLKGADYEDSLRGTKLDGFGMDEADYIKKHIYPNILSGQLLNIGNQEPGFAWFISSPNEKGASWFPAFVEEAKRKRLNGDKSWAGFNFTIFDNPLLSKKYIEETREMVTEDSWNLEYMAIPSLLAGRLYSEFSRETNLGEYRGDGVLPVVRGVDWGIDHPTVCLWVKVDVVNDTIYVYDEFRRTDLRIKESCGVIKEMTGSVPVTATICDPSMNKRNSQTPLTDMQEFFRCGIPVVSGDNRERGKDIVKLMLKTGKLKVHPKCKYLIHEFENLQYGQDIADDVSDACRYVCVWVHDRFPGWKKSFEVSDKPRERGKFYMDDIFKDKPNTDYSIYLESDVEI